MIRRINGEQSPECGLFHERLELELDWIEASCKIDAAQRNKLRIAGRGDIKRFFDRMSDLKRRYRQVKGKPAELARLQQALSAIKRGTSDNLFGETSLFCKTLLAVLSSEQLVLHARAREDARVFQQRAVVARAVQLCEVAVGLKDDQRAALSELFLAQARQLKSEQTGQPDVDELLVVRTAGSSRVKLSTILDERQWAALSALIKHRDEAANPVLGGGDVDFVIEAGEVDAAAESRHANDR